MVGAATAGDLPEATMRLEQVRLENEKLKLQLAELGQVKPWYHMLTQMVPMITAIVAIAGFWWGVVQYGDQQTRIGRRRNGNS